VKTRAIVRCGLLIKDFPAIEREAALKAFDGQVYLLPDETVVYFIK
jgi:hypothetical protein